MAKPLLDGRSAFITGGAQGIGLAVARAFLRHGASVTVADVAADALRSAEAEGLRAVLLDVTDPDATERAADEAAAAQGGIDVAVANAGILVLQPALQLGLEAWRRVLDVNLTGAFLTATTLGRRMVERGGGGRIILTSSLFGLRGGVENTAYSASKFGMIGLMQCLAAELAPHGILVNAVCPGQVDTPMLDSLFTERAALQHTSAATLRAAFESRIPVRRLGTREEVADTYVYLASPLSSYVTGQSIVVDGGWQLG